MQNNIHLPPNLHLYVWLFSEGVEYHLTSEGDILYFVQWVQMWTYEPEDQCK